MSNTEFELVPFSFGQVGDELADEMAWMESEGERGRTGRGPAARRSARPAAAKPRPRPRPPQRSPQRPAQRRPMRPPSRWPGPASSFGSSEPPGPCVCPSHGSEYVRWVQSALNRIDNTGLPVDGSMNPATRSALRAFQARQGLPADGIAGPDTEQALRDAQRPGAAPALSAEPAAGDAEFEFEFDAAELDELDEFEGFEAEAPSRPTLRQGSRGTAVTDLQRRLAAAGFSPGPADGIFGSLTGNAVRAFQRARGLAVDGIVGPQTWGALLGTAPVVPRPTPTPTPPPVYPGTPASSLRGRIVQAALQEWQRWGNGTIKESDPRMRSVLEAYWRAATGSPPPAANWWEPYWSAVFISWVMREAGAGNQFQYSSAHTAYVAAAKRNRVAGNANPFKAYRISEAPLRPGDLVCAERSGSGVTYDNVDDGNFRSSHSDVVVEVNPGHIVVIGGNVSDTVGRKTISVDASGKLKGSPYYAVLRAGS